MVVEVLKPEDCLKLPYPMKRQKNSFPSPKPNRTNRAQPKRKKRSTNTSPIPLPPVKTLVMGQVKILKRGEDLKITATEMSKNRGRENVDVNLGPGKPDAVSVPTLIPFTELKNNRSRNKVDSAAFYAGSAFVSSPSPSSVPMPAFFRKKNNITKTDDVTSDLKRILRLDF